MILGHARKIYDDDEDADRITQHQFEFLCLTQVCREIRTEYLPLYRAQTSLCLRADRTYDYIRTHLSPSAIMEESIVGKIFMDLSTHDDLYVDVKPLLQLCSRSNRLSIDVMGVKTNEDGPYVHGTIWKLMDEILNIWKPSLFERYLGKAIDCLELRSWPVRAGGSFI